VELSLEVANGAMETVVAKTKTLVSMAFAEGDERAELLAEKIGHEAYGIVVKVFDLPSDGSAKGNPTVALDPNDLRAQVSHTQGRILTYVELAFPVPHQCEAMKSLVSEALWEFPQRVHRLLETRIAEPG